MKFNSLAIAAALGLTATAQPTNSCIPAVPTPETFGVIAIRSGSGVQNSGFNAALGSIFAGLPKQNATCAGSDDGFATFYIQDEGLYLYGPSNKTQQVYVDRSGMGMAYPSLCPSCTPVLTDDIGQGNIGYTSGESTPRNAEVSGWAIKNNYLEFDGSGLIACPNSIGGAYSIWLSAGIDNPAGNSDCVGIAGRVEKAEKPVRCTYTASS
ncbi:hypothetical protein BJX76DRAFT_97325 [Aspergillus varians]